MVLSAECKDRVLALYGTCLMSILPVEGDVETFWHEGYACRVGIDSVETDSRVAGWVAEKIDTLIRVG